MFKAVSRKTTRRDSFGVKRRNDLIRRCESSAERRPFTFISITFYFTHFPHFPLADLGGKPLPTLFIILWTPVIYSFSPSNVISSHKLSCPSRYFCSLFTYIIYFSPILPLSMMIYFYNSDLLQILLFLCHFDASLSDLFQPIFM